MIDPEFSLIWLPFLMALNHMSMLLSCPKLKYVCVGENDKKNSAIYRWNETGNYCMRSRSNCMTTIVNQQKRLVLTFGDIYWFIITEYVHSLDTRKHYLLLISSVFYINLLLKICCCSMLIYMRVYLLVLDCWRKIIRQPFFALCFVSIQFFHI